MNYNELKCDSPALPTKPGSEEAAIETYNLTILVNDDDEAGQFNISTIINLR